MKHPGITPVDLGLLFKIWGKLEGKNKKIEEI